MGKILEQAIQKKYSSEPVKMKMLTLLQIWEMQIKAGMSYLHLLKKKLKCIKMYEDTTSFAYF